MIVKHYKGGTYTVLFQCNAENDPVTNCGWPRLFGAFDATNCANRDTVMVRMGAGRVFVTGSKLPHGTKVVVYVSHQTGGVFVRDKAEFEEPIKWPDGVVRPRFAFDHEFERPVKP